jgi:hypothetical protein
MHMFSPIETHRHINTSNMKSSFSNHVMHHHAMHALVLFSYL